MESRTTVSDMQHKVKVLSAYQKCLKFASQSITNPVASRG